MNLPPAPVGPGGEDAIETSSGTRCRQSINASGPYLDFGVGVTQDETETESYTDRSMIGYARIVLPLTGAVERIDCKRLYELEIEKLRMEIELMKLGLEG